MDKTDSPSFLTHDEELRLKCLERAIACSAGNSKTSDVVEQAKEFERFVKGELN